MSIESLINFDGDDGDTTYTAEVGPDPSFLGSAEIDTDWSHFPGGGSLLCGSSKLVQVGSDADYNWMHDGSESWTVEVIIHPTAVNGGTRGIFDTFNTTTDVGVEFYQPSGFTSTHVALMINDGTAAACSNIIVNNGTYLVAAMYDHTTDKYRVTCRQEAGSYTESSWVSRTDETTDSSKIRIGQRRSNGSYYAGNIDCVKLTRGELVDTDYWPDEPWTDAQPANETFLSAPFIFNTARPVLYNDFSAQVSGAAAGHNIISHYTLEISGDPAISLPISSWQATAQLDAQQYVQCVVPAVDDYVLDIAARQGSSNFAIYRSAIINGYTHRSKMVEAPLASASFSRGKINYSCTLSGYNSAAEAPTTQSVRELVDIRSIEKSATGLSRVRCQLDWLARPGDLVYTGDAYPDPVEENRTVYEDSFTASYINYYANANDSYMDVGER